MKKFFILIILFFIITNSPFSQEPKQDESKTETTIKEESKSENSISNEAEKEPEKSENINIDPEPVEKEEPKPESSPKRPIRISFFFDLLTAEKQISDSLAIGAGGFNGNNYFYRNYDSITNINIDPINIRITATERYSKEKNYPTGFFFAKWFPFQNNFFLNFQLGIADNGKLELNDVFSRSASKTYMLGNLYTIEYQKSPFLGVNSGYRLDLGRFYLGFELGIGLKRQAGNRVDLVYGAEDAASSASFSEKAADYYLHKFYYSDLYKDTTSVFPIYYMYAGISL